MAKTYDYDVGIIGGGPAGSATAAYLAMAGLKCIVLESETFPRPHVGESLVPASTRVFRDLGLWDKLENGGFVKKYGAVWTADEQKPAYDHDWEGLEPDCVADIRFEERQQEGVDKNYTFHVDRGKFDQVLLEHAEEKGATAWQACRVSDVDVSDATAPRISYQRGDEKGDLTVRAVVDASGRKTFLGRKLKLREVDDKFDQYASHTWFEGYDRSKLDTQGGRDEYIFIHFLPVSNTWIWQIPITEEITSIGVVTQKKNFQKSKASREQFFWDCVASRPKLYEGLKAAKQLRPFTEEADYSYGMREICGDGWVLVGDAARFVDPIFSSGVSIALTGAKFASKDLIAAAETGDFSKKAFKTYETTMRRGTRNWYEFINLYYRLNVLFTAFIINPRYRLDVLKLLQGDVYDEQEPAVLGEMRRIVTEVEDNPNHVWHNLLNDLTSEAIAPQF